MPKYRELREQKGLQAKQVADAASIDATMYSRFENYRALPIPTDFERITEALQCLPTDIYTPEEIRLIPSANTATEATGGAKALRETTEYKMTVRLNNDCRKVLTREVLQQCGFKSINEWVIYCVMQLKSQYEAANKKAPQPYATRHTERLETKQTTNAPTGAILSQINPFVK